MAPIPDEERKILKGAIPRPPTRTEELAYLEQLAREFRGQSFTDFMAPNPWRNVIHHKEHLKGKIYYESWLNYIKGGVLSFPVAIFVANRFKHFSSGLPAFYINHGYDYNELWAATSWGSYNYYRFWGVFAVSWYCMIKVFDRYNTDYGIMDDEEFEKFKIRRVL